MVKIAALSMAALFGSASAFAPVAKVGLTDGNDDVDIISAYLEN
jgi:hypothetical protein